jgi:UDP-glucose 4-epimerase
MRVLITGGAGYIGSVIAEDLVAEGHQVFVYDNLARGHRAAVTPEAELIVGDLLERDKLVRIFGENGIEAVIHLAAYSQIGESVADPHKYYNNNLGGGLSLLGAMVESGVKRIVFSSTCAVYGTPASLPITEDLPTAPVNPYGQTKLAFERALHWYGEAYGLRSAVLRYFNAAGATERCGEDHQPESHLIPLVLRVAAGEMEHLNVYGDDYSTPDGSCIRDYIHVLDLASAHRLSLLALERGSCLYNLGYGAGYSVYEVVEMARQVTGRRIPTEVAPRRAGDPPILIAGADRVMSDLGWQPRHSELDVIIESAWRWHRAHPHGYEE